MTQGPAAMVELAIPPSRYRALLTGTGPPSRLYGMQSKRAERKADAMSVSIFELNRAGTAGRRGGHYARVKRQLALHEQALDRARPWQRYLGWALTGAGAAMIPWLFVLAGELPAQTTAVHWNVVWIGLDSLEAAGLASTGLLLRRRDARAGLTAAATATLLAVDAWFDVLTSAPGADRAVAIAMAAGAEVPIAALCAFLAVRLRPRCACECER